MIRFTLKDERGTTYSVYVDPGEVAAVRALQTSVPVYRDQSELLLKRSPHRLVVDGMPAEVVGRLTAEASK